MAHRIAPRILFCIVSAAVITTLAIYCGHIRREEITLGTLAEKSTDHYSRGLRVTNAGSSKRAGSFVVFAASIPTRYPVVFRLASTDAIPVNCTTFTGVCRGVQVDILDGCPCDPPFVLIDNVKPDEREQ